MRPEVAGLTIYLYGIVRYTNLISYIIFQNGIIYHYFYPENKWIRLGDTYKSFLKKKNDKLKRKIYIYLKKKWNVAMEKQN